MKKRLSRKNAVYTPNSATTQSINYDVNHHLLEVAFTSGEIYQYLHVPASLWNEYKQVIQSGNSSGTFLNTRIKPIYTYVKITED
jgi:hypothetical protein